jgi:hypothetical protein
VVSSQQFSADREKLTKMFLYHFILSFSCITASSFVKCFCLEKENEAEFFCGYCGCGDLSAFGNCLSLEKEAESFCGYCGCGDLSAFFHKYVGIQLRKRSTRRMQVGKLTSCVEAKEGSQHKYTGLAYIRRQAGGAGLKVEIEEGISGVVVDVPFLTRSLPQ